MRHESIDPLTCQEKPSGVYKMQENALAADITPLTPIGDLTASTTPDPLAVGDGAGCPFQEPRPRSRASALHLLLWYDKDSRRAVYVCNIVILYVLACLT